MDQDLLNSIATPMNLIVPKLYLGHLGAALDLDHLTKMKVSHVVQVFEQDLRPFDLIYHSVVIDDDVNVNLIPYIQPAFDFIENALESGSGVLVHCQMGTSRSASK
jgi:protein-tyrosine phosphatase